MMRHKEKAQEPSTKTTNITEKDLQGAVRIIQTGIDVERCCGRQFVLGTAKHTCNIRRTVEVSTIKSTFIEEHLRGTILSTFY